MLHSTLHFPPYDTVRVHEGKGNYAVAKYYKWPWRAFYRHKLKMIVDLMDGEFYDSLLDFGSGPGVLKPELSRHALRYLAIDSNTWPSIQGVDCIVAASTLEFVNLDIVLPRLAKILRPNGAFIVASPMQNLLTSAYFGLIGDKKQRHSETQIIEAISDHFKIERIDNWMNLYFALRATCRI